MIAVLVVSGLFLSCSCFLLSLLYWRGKKIQKKRAMRRYLERGEVSGRAGGLGAVGWGGDNGCGGFALFHPCPFLPPSIPIHGVHP